MSYIQDSLSDREEIQDLFKPHWFIWVPNFVVLTIGAVLAACIAYLFSWPIALIVFGGFGLLAVLQALTLISLEQGVTNKRIIRKTGIIGRQSEEMKLSSIETVEIDQGVWGRIFNYGTVRVTGKGLSAVFFPKIDNPMAVKRAIESVSNPIA